VSDPITMRRGAALYAVGLATCFGLDMLWVGLLAHDFYARQLGNLLRPDVQWVPAILFYFIYVAALIVFVALPAVERRSLSRAILLGAFFGLAAYAAYDLTCLAMIRDYPIVAGLVDLAWGAVLSATVCAAVYSVARHGPRLN
jgi:uncharacterized membrane protein